MVDLSIIIVSYNTCELIKQCIDALLSSLKSTPALPVEIIIVDNGSTDESVEMLKKYTLPISLHTKNVTFRTIFNSENLGFSKANNMALEQASGTYILFLNSDVLIQDVNFEDLIYYLNKNPEVGVLTVKVTLPDGHVDWASHRGTPTLWRSFAYFTKLEKLFAHIPKVTKIFGGYHLKYLDINTIHEIDSPSGAFYLTRKNILDKTNGFDTRFFMYGEDLDLSHRIKEMGFKIIYYPLFTVLHLKYKSGIKRGIKKTETNTRNYFYEAMKIFYDKHFGAQNSHMKNRLVHFFIDLKKKRA